ncbi:FAD-dependent oxidoreductase [Desulfogranum japonicum]|uniref:FAD-dependent oxidoreductase n=1 Tax=Desulfogranum japonicum TaxID=231447 RepID=UPI000405E746|nr:FAD-dependent oxidoreductase [Desulfogranum japonicum]
MKKTDVAIVGASAAGLMAAVTLRKRNPEKSVTVIRHVVKTPVPCGIPYIYGTLKRVEKNIIPDENFIKMGVDIKYMEVNAVDRENKSISFVDGTSLSYDKLILSSGSKPFVPPLPGVDQENVFVIEKDPLKLQKLHTALESAKNVVVVGGGFIGVEMAEQIALMAGKEAMKESRITVSLIEMLPHCLMMACEEEFCIQAENELTKLGVTVKTNSGVKEIAGQGKVTSVRLADGTELETDLVLVSIGAVPNIDLANQCGLSADPRKGILVDEYMQTQDPDILAAGDCASKTSFITGKTSGIRLASVACSEGMIAASNLYDETKRRNLGALGAFATKVGSQSIAAAGLTSKAAADEGIEVVIGEATTPNRHPASLPDCITEMKAKLLFQKDNGKIVGGHILGGESSADMVNAIAVAIQTGATAEELATMQYATHPLLTASPLFYHIMLAAENGAIQLRKAAKQKKLSREAA